VDTAIGCQKFMRVPGFVMLKIWWNNGILILKHFRA